VTATQAYALGIVTGVIIWLALVWLIAEYADRKGHTFWGVFALGVLSTPGIALAAALLVEDRRVVREDGETVAEWETLTRLEQTGTLTAEEAMAARERLRDRVRNER
jgi:hypothetical protein